MKEEFTITVPFLCTDEDAKERDFRWKLLQCRENIQTVMRDLYDLEMTLEDRGIGELCQASCSIAGTALDITAEFIDEILEDMEAEE